MLQLTSFFNMRIKIQIERSVNNMIKIVEYDYEQLKNTELIYHKLTMNIGLDFDIM